jgi:hypothetical protein
MPCIILFTNECKHTKTITPYDNTNKSLREKKKKKKKKIIFNFGGGKKKKKKKILFFSFLFAWDEQ